jgi:hypothetical protein
VPLVAVGAAVAFLLFCCFTAALLLLSTHTCRRWLSEQLLLFCSTAALLLLYCCFTSTFHTHLPQVAVGAAVALAPSVG